jgi:hypothetical protein
MSKSPIYQVQRKSRKEMDRLYDEHHFAERLVNCVETAISVTERMHAAFCCNMQVSRYVDTATNEEIAIIATITYAGNRKPPKRTVTKLVIGYVIYRHELRHH